MIAIQDPLRGNNASFVSSVDFPNPICDVYKFRSVSLPDAAKLVTSSNTKVRDLKVTRLYSKMSFGNRATLASGHSIP